MNTPMTPALPTTSSSLTDLFRLKAAQKKSMLISLENRDRIPVGAIDLSATNISKLAVCETIAMSEKYYIYLDGLSVFFTYWREV